jgi:3-hydroxyacyl-[acyl-carrier-protein] dehydratase
MTSSTITPEPSAFPQPSAEATREQTLRELLKRCPPRTLQAALQYQQSGDIDYLPHIVLGVLERFCESERRPLLHRENGALRLVDDLALDSLTLMEMVLLLEDTVGISVRNEELQGLKTVHDVVQFVTAKAQERDAANPRPAA